MYVTHGFDDPSHDEDQKKWEMIHSNLSDLFAQIHHSLAEKTLVFDCLKYWRKK